MLYEKIPQGHLTYLLKDVFKDINVNKNSLRMVLLKGPDLQS